MGLPVRLLKLLLVLLLSAASCRATWTCTEGATGCTVTTTRSCSASAATCTITVTSTTAGRIGIVCAMLGGSSLSLSSVTGAGTWTVQAARGSDSTANGAAQCAYNFSESAGVTSIVVNFSSSASNAAAYYAFSSSLGNVTFDVGGSVDDSSACTSCAGAALSTTTSNNYLLVQNSFCGGTCSAINQSYTGVFNAGGDGSAFKINVTSAGTTPNWTQTSGRLAGSGMAIYEKASGSTTRSPQMMSAGVGK